MLRRSAGRAGNCSIRPARGPSIDIGRPTEPACGVTRSACFGDGANRMFWGSPPKSSRLSGPIPRWGQHGSSVRCSRSGPFGHGQVDPATAQRRNHLHDPQACVCQKHCRSLRAGISPIFRRGIAHRLPGRPGRSSTLISVSANRPPGRSARKTSAVAGVLSTSGERNRRDHCVEAAI
jgi:hypothetical protein